MTGYEISIGYNGYHDCDLDDAWQELKNTVLFKGVMMADGTDYVEIKQIVADFVDDYNSSTDDSQNKQDAAKAEDVINNPEPEEMVKVITI